LLWLVRAGGLVHLQQRADPLGVVVHVLAVAVPLVVVVVVVVRGVLQRPINYLNENKRSSSGDSHVGGPQKKKKKKPAPPPPPGAQPTRARREYRLPRFLSFFAGLPRVHRCFPLRASTGSEKKVNFRPGSVFLHLTARFSCVK
jgi:hypothetical protein